MTEQYRESMKKGLEYQDFVSDRLLRNFGIVVGTYTSKKYQQERGESASGIEIKFDDKLATTGNIYIETAEKSDPENEEYYPSGIYRKDSTWLYLIGNYEEAFLFSKEQLQIIQMRRDLWGKRGIKYVETKTSQGFLYPIVEAVNSRTCLKHFVFPHSWN